MSGHGTEFHLKLHVKSLPQLSVTNLECYNAIGWILEIMSTVAIVGSITLNNKVFLGYIQGHVYEIIGMRVYSGSSLLIY